MGILDDLFEKWSLPLGHKHKKKKQLQTVPMKIKMDCEGCVRKVKHAAKSIKGVNSVEVDPKQSKVTVVGYVEPKKVLKKIAEKTGKKVEPWPYIPYTVVDHPYAPGAYDKKAPPGYVRNVLNDPEAAKLVRADSTEIKYTTAFSDENPNACTIM